MSQITHVFVIVPEGREVPIPQSEGSSAGGGVLIAKPGKQYAVRWTTYTRKRINAGDFILTDAKGAKVKEAHDARAPETIKLAPDGTVDADQRPDDEINKEAEARAAADAKRAELDAARAHRTPHARETFDTSDGKDH
jgi:hypothetical protein